MRDRPTAVDLLRTARRTFMEELLPALPNDCRYSAHLVGAALAIAAREAEAGSAAEESEHRALAALLGADGGIEDLNRRLAAAIRAGRLDDHRATHRILADATRAKLLENNPAYLGGPET